MSRTIEVTWLALLALIEANPQAHALVTGSGGQVVLGGATYWAQRPGVSR